MDESIDEWMKECGWIEDDLLDGWTGEWIDE